MVDDQEQQLSEEEEQSLQEAVRSFLEIPMFVLAMVILAMLIIEFTTDIPPAWRRGFFLTGSIIWWIFVLEYTLRVFLAEDRRKFFSKYWLDGLFIIVPFLRVLRVLRVVRTVRLLRVMQPATLGRTYVTTRRGLRQLSKTMGKRSFPYVLASTTVVLFIGALMVFILEQGAPGSEIRTYGSALWWATGTMTTVGVDIQPITSEARFIAVFIMIYGVGIFGYIAATLASYFASIDVSERPTPGAEGGQGLTPSEKQQLVDISEKLDRLLSAIEERDEPDEKIG